MKNFNELTKKELTQLTETQVDAYIDIELANKGITKQIETNISYPNYVQMTDVLPEMDMTIYEVDGYKFADIETAKKFSEFVGTLLQVQTDYDYHSNASVYYAKSQNYSTPTVQLTKMYSEAKYLACKATIQEIKKKKKEQDNKNEETTESVINYEAIDNVKYEIKRKVREAIEFFSRVEVMAKNYNKYWGITNDKEIALKTLYTVYNVQDEETKKEVESKITELNSQEMIKTQ